MWVVYAILSAFFAALTTVFAKVGVHGIDSDLATGIRTAVILVLAFGIIAYRGLWSDLHAVSGRTWLFLILSGAATGLSWLFYFKALQEGDVSRVASLDKLSIVFTILLAFLFLREPVSARVIIGACLIALGGMCMILK